LTEGEFSPDCAANIGLGIFAPGIMNAVNDRQQIEQALRDHADSIRAYGVIRLGLFGSFSRGQQHEDSDVDLLVEFAEGTKTFDHFMGLADLLEGILGRRVELVTPESLSPYLGAHILEEVEYVAFAA
jgi:predicted nucleotidyltransferase